MSLTRSDPIAILSLIAIFTITSIGGSVDEKKALVTYFISLRAFTRNNLKEKHYLQISNCCMSKDFSNSVELSICSFFVAFSIIK